VSKLQNVVHDVNVNGIADGKSMLL